MQDNETTIEEQHDTPAPAPEAPPPAPLSHPGIAAALIAIANALRAIGGAFPIVSQHMALTAGELDKHAATLSGDV